MLLFLSIMLCCSALKIYLLCSILCRTIILVRVLCYLYTSLYEQITTCSRQLRKTVLLECIYEWCPSIPLDLSNDDCFIRVYRSFTSIFHKHMNIAINIFYIFPIMLALCLMLSLTHYT